MGSAILKTVLLGISVFVSSAWAQGAPFRPNAAAALLSSEAPSTASGHTAKSGGFAKAVTAPAEQHVARGATAENYIAAVYPSATPQAHATGTTAGAVPADSASSASGPCDLNADGVVNVLDVQLGVNMYNGVQLCTANVDGPNVCNSYVINQLVSSALGGACSVVSGNSHSVSLSWTASTSSGINHYNIYRTSPTLTNPSPTTYAMLGSTTGATTSYSDATVSAGFTYQYYATAVDSNGNESAASNTATAPIPFP